MGLEDFDCAILRAVAGIEKKRSILVGAEKAVVARHEAGHAIVSTAVQVVIPATAAAVEKLSIIPRSGGALGWAFCTPASCSAAHEAPNSSPKTYKPHYSHTFRIDAGATGFNRMHFMQHATCKTMRSRGYREGHDCSILLSASVHTDRLRGDHTPSLHRSRCDTQLQSCF